MPDGHRLYLSFHPQRNSMAISATIHKVSLNIANMDTHYYQTHELTVAQHPSETNFRFMIGLVAFARHASDQLVFTRGLSSDDEPALWEKTLTDEIASWIDLGQPVEKRIRKASGRSKKVSVYTYQERKAKVWWEQNEKKLQRFSNLSVCHIDAPNIETLKQRTMTLSCTLQDGEMYLTDDVNSIAISFKKQM